MALPKFPDNEVTTGVDPSPLVLVAHGDMSDQEIRARALECACRLFAGCMKDPGTATAFDGCKAEFESYIRDGMA